MPAHAASRGGGRSPPGLIAPGVDVPQEVEELVRDGLAKRPEDRIGSAAEYLRRIDALLGPEEPSLTTPEPSPDPSPTIPAGPGGGATARTDGGRSGRCA